MFFQVATAGADDLRKPLPKLVDLHGYLLRTRARGSHHADFAAPDGVGKAQGFSVNDGCAAVGTHHQQPFFDGFLFEAKLILNGNIVREEHHMQTRVQRVLNLYCRILTRHGD